MCVHATSFVFLDSNGRRFSTFRLNSWGEDGVHHLTVRLLFLAIRSQEEMFAPWSIEERMISASWGNSRAMERFENNWVVDDPRTFVGHHGQLARLVQLGCLVIPTSSGSALMKAAVASRPF